MSCACGAPSSPPEDGTIVLCGDCGRQNLACPRCGAGLSAAAEAVVMACPYCDTPFQHRDLGDKPPYFPINLTEGEAQAVLLRFLLSRFGIPHDLERRLQVVHCEPVYVPIHLFTVTARLTEAIIETDTTAVLCSQKPWYREALRGHRFAARAKLWMDPEKVRARIYPRELSPEQVARQADTFGETLLRRDRQRFSEVRGESAITREDGGLVFYPLYEIRYRYRGRTYQGVLDAASGVVCQADHPMSLRTRAMVVAAGGVMLAFTGICTLLFAALGATGDPVFFLSALISLFAGLPASAHIAWIALKSHKGAENLDVREQPLDVRDLSTRLPVSERKAH